MPITKVLFTDGPDIEIIVKIHVDPAGWGDTRINVSDEEYESMAREKLRQDSHFHDAYKMVEVNRI